MNDNEHIVTMCLFGIVRNQRGAERDACLRAISENYGTRIAGLVKKRLTD